MYFRSEMIPPSIDNLMHPYKGQGDKAKDSVEDDPLSSQGAKMESHVNKENIDPAINYDEQSCIIEASTYSSLQEKVAKFIQKGELDTIEGKFMDQQWLCL